MLWLLLEQLMSLMAPQQLFSQQRCCHLYPVCHPNIMFFNLFVITVTHFLGSYWCLGAFNCIPCENPGMHMVQGDVTMALLFRVCLDEAVSSAGCGQAEAECDLL